MNSVSINKFKELMHSDSAKARAIRSSVWTVLGHALSQGFRLISNLFLTRLLFPEVFGVMAIAQVIISGLIMFSDVGIIPSIIRSRNIDDQRFLNTAWTIQCIRGVLLWFITLGISFPISDFYERPELRYLIPCAAVALLVNGLFPIKVILASRKMNHFKVMIFQLTGQVAGSILSILLAIQYKNALVFVFGIILTEAVRLILYRCFLEGSNNKFDLHKPAVSEIIGFGKWIFLSSICGFIASNANVFILGKYLKPDIFGVYSVALVLSVLPLTICNMLRDRVLLPLFSEMDRNHSNIQTIQKTRYLVLVAASGVTLAAMTISPWFFTILYDERYNLAGYISLVVLMSSLPELLLIVTFNKLVVEGRGKNYASLKFVHASLISISISILVTDYGIIGVCLANLFAGITTYLLLLLQKGIHTVLNAKVEFTIFIVFYTVSTVCIYFYSDGLIELWELSQ